MEARRITIVSTKVQKKYVINSAATTLGELKRDLSEHNIDYSNMTFMEGLTRTELLSDDSLLPQNVQRTSRETGETTTTNELVFMLTNVDKKVKSGAMSRKDLYNEIRKYDLADKVREVFGKPFTMCKSADLASLIAEHEHNLHTTDCVNCNHECNEEEEEIIELILSPSNTQLKNAICTLVEILFEDNYLADSEKEAVLNILEEDEGEKEEEDFKPMSNESPYSDDEIYSMFNGI